MITITPDNIKGGIDPTHEQFSINLDDTDTKTRQLLSNLISYGVFTNDTVEQLEQRGIL